MTINVHDAYQKKIRELENALEAKERDLTLLRSHVRSLEGIDVYRLSCDLSMALDVLRAFADPAHWDGPEYAPPGSFLTWELPNSVVSLLSRRHTLLSCRDIHNAPH